MFKNLLYEVRDGIAVITFNRPEIGNAIDVATIHELGEAVDQIAHDEGVRAAILTGAGDKVFVSGGDVKQFLRDLKTMDDARRMVFSMQEVLFRMEDLGVPVIGALNGSAFGGGCETALACDYRIASEKAQLGFRQVKMGIMVGWGGGQRLLRLVGRSKAMELLLTGEVISAQEALRIGLIDKVAAHEQVMAEALAMAQKIAQNPPLAVRFAKRALTQGRDMSCRAGASYEAELLAALWVSEDHREAERAFMEKRPPQFQGR